MWEFAPPSTHIDIGIGSRNPKDTFNFIYLFVAVLGLHCCVRAFSSCGKWGPLSVAVCKLLTVVASLVAERGL